MNGRWTPDFEWFADLDRELRGYHHNPGLVAFDAWPGPFLYFALLENA